MTISVRRSLIIALTVGGLALTALLMVAWWQLTRASDAVLEDGALVAAESYARTLEAMRSIYSSKVIARLPPSEIDVTHDYLIRDAAVPLPATLTIMLAEEGGC